MILDLGRTGPREDVRADICIVGAGAAGITLAHALTGSGLSVCLVESGGHRTDPDVEALNEGENNGRLVEFTEGRARRFGGTTTKWTGRCTPFDSEDFDPREWLPGARWPIRYEEVARYHTRAQEYCGFPWRWAPDHRVVDRLSSPPVPRFNPHRVAPFVWRYAPRGARVYQDWGKRFRRSLERARDVRVLLNATLTDFHLADASARIEAITVRALSGATARVSADTFVLCCGGVANPALLLEGKDATGAPFGDSGGQVGRCFQQHVRGVIANVDVDRAGSRRLQELYNVFLRNGGIQHEIGFRLATELQRRERLLNASAFMSYMSDPTSSWDSAKKAVDALQRGRLDKDFWLNLGRAAARPAPVIENLFRRGTDRHALLSTERVEIVVDLEQEPDPESRVTLSDKRDAFGRRLPRVDWRINELERRTAAHFAAALRDEFDRLKLGVVRPASWLEPAIPLDQAPVTGSHHHIATTRMSEDASSGVVDGNCKVHDMANLYIGGCSVFATGGHANPTFMIVALALRLADHLRATLAA